MREELPRRLGLATASLLVIASMVGTGVFTTTGLMVEDLRSDGAVLLAWAVGGLAALFGALAYAELTAALPHNGGEYQLLTRIYHPAVGFIAGVVSLVVGFSAPIAASAIAFGEYFARIVPGTPPIASALVLVTTLSVLHAAHVRGGGGVQNVFAAGKALLIAGFITAGLLAADVTDLGEGARPTARAVLSPDFAVSLIIVSFAYSGWNAATYVAGEIRRPGHVLPRALVIGTLAVTGLYLLINVAFLIAAPHEVLAGHVEVGHVAAAHLFGEGAGRTLSAVIGLGLISTVGALIMTGPRVYEAMGRDHPRLRVLSWRTERSGPVISIALQAALAVVMIVTSTFEALLTYIGVVLAAVSALTVAGVFVMRVRAPHLERPYRTWGHPLTSLAFIGLMVWMVVHTLLQRPLVAAAAAGTIAGALAAYFPLRDRGNGPS
ncbi:MAG: APC family permease [Myxococcota bacterium]